MKNKSEMLLEIFKAQVSNKSAEACANISIWQLIFLIISSIFIISYPFINQRVKQSVTMSDARLYPGLGGVLQDIGKLDATFSVNAYVTEKHNPLEVAELDIRTETWKTDGSNSPAILYMFGIISRRP